MASNTLGGSAASGQRIRPERPFKQSKAWLRAERFLKRRGQSHDDGSDDAYVIHAIVLAELVTATERRMRQEFAKRCDALVKAPGPAIGPWEVGGTDYKPENMRCLKEGVTAAARFLKGRP